MFRMDRQNISHEGVASYVRDDLAASTELLDSFSNGTTKLMTLYIKQLDLLIITVYIPPNTTLNQFEEFLRRLSDTLLKLPKQTTEVIIAGDLNLPHLIGDIDSDLEYAEASSFADDTKIKKQIGSAEDTHKLKDDMTNNIKIFNNFRISQITRICK